VGDGDVAVEHFLLRCDVTPTSLLQGTGLHTGWHLHLGSPVWCFLDDTVLVALATRGLLTSCTDFDRSPCLRFGTGATPLCSPPEAFMVVAAGLHLHLFTAGLTLWYARFLLAGTYVG
jgi:hypothetical protein